MRELIVPRIAAPAALLALVLLTSACRGNVFDVEDVIEIIDNAGYTVSEPTQKGVPFVWQNKGLSVNVDGELVVVFRYSKPSTDPSGVDRDPQVYGLEAIDKIVEKGTGFWEVDKSLGEELYYRNGRIVVFFGGHSKADAIKQVLDQKIPCQPITRLDCL